VGCTSGCARGVAASSATAVTGTRRSADAARCASEGVAPAAFVICTPTTLACLLLRDLRDLRDTDLLRATGRNARAIRWARDTSAELERGGPKGAGGDETSVDERTVGQGRRWHPRVCDGATRPSDERRPSPSARSRGASLAGEGMVASAARGARGHHSGASHESSESRESRKSSQQSPTTPPTHSVVQPAADSQFPIPNSDSPSPRSPRRGMNRAVEGGSACSEFADWGDPAPVSRLLSADGAGRRRARRGRAAGTLRERG